MALPFLSLLLTAACSRNQVFRQEIHVQNPLGTVVTVAYEKDDIVRSHTKTELVSAPRSPEVNFALQNVQTFTDIKNKVVYTSSDEGKTWKMYTATDLQKTKKAGLDSYKLIHNFQLSAIKELEAKLKKVKDKKKASEIEPQLKILKFSEFSVREAIRASGEDPLKSLTIQETARKENSKLGECLIFEAKEALTGNKVFEYCLVRVEKAALTPEKLKIRFTKDEPFAQADAIREFIKKSDYKYFPAFSRAFNQGEEVMRSETVAIGMVKNQDPKLFKLPSVKAD